jgi:hypothetical protein
LKPAQPALSLTKKAETQRANRAVSETQIFSLTLAPIPHPRSSGQARRALTSSHDSAATRLPVIDSFVFQRSPSGTKRTRRSVLSVQKGTPSACTRTLHEIDAPKSERPGCQQNQEIGDPRRLDWSVRDVSAKEGRSVFLPTARDDANGLTSMIAIAKKGPEAWNGTRSLRPKILTSFFRRKRPVCSFSQSPPAATDLDIDASFVCPTGLFLVYKHTHTRGGVRATDLLRKMPWGNSASGVVRVTPAGDLVQHKLTVFLDYRALSIMWRKTDRQHISSFRKTGLHSVCSHNF